MVRAERTSLRSQGLLVNSALVLFSFVFCLVLAEILVRFLAPQMTGPVQFAFDNELGAIPVPDQQGVRSLPGVYTYSYSNDERGMRIVPGATEGRPARKRILLLGDSFTYGIGVDDDQTFGAYLQRSIPDALIANAGTGGKGTDYALKYLSVRGAELKPDVVVLGFFPNDFCDNKREEYFSRSGDGTLTAKRLDLSVGARKSFLARIPAYDWLITHSHLANLVKQAAIEFLMRSPGQQADAGVVVGSVPGGGCSDPSAEDLTIAYLSALKQKTEHLNASLLCFYIPDVTELDLEDVSRDEAAFLRIARYLGIKAFSMKPYLKKSGSPPSKLYLAEGHWSPLAHEIAGRVLELFVHPILSGP